MNKHKHYQTIRAYADGWKLEYLAKTTNEWKAIVDPTFLQNYEYRIVPDENGWLPWYGGDDISSYPVMVKFRDGGLLLARNPQDIAWNDINIIAYRVTEEAKPQPKKKVKMWQWVYKRPHQAQLTSCFYPTLEAASEGCGGATIIQRADWTEIEVEES